MTGQGVSKKYNNCPKTRLCSLAGWDVRFTQNITNGDFFRLNNLIHGTKCDNTLQESFVTRHVLSRSLTRNVNMKHFLKIQPENSFIISGSVFCEIEAAALSFVKFETSNYVFI